MQAPVLRLRPPCLYVLHREEVCVPWGNQGRVVTYTRSPEARQRDALNHEIDELRGQLADAMTSLRKAQDDTREARNEAAQLVIEARKRRADADKYAARIRAEYADHEATVNQAAQILHDAERDARRMRAAAKRHMDRKANERPVNGLLRELMSERYGT